MCLADDFVLFLRDHVAPADDGDEVLGVTDFALEAFPDLVAREDGGGVGWVDGFGVGAVDGDHFGCDGDGDVAVAVAVALAGVSGLSWVGGLICLGFW